ncbi:arylsulfatase [Flammeovirga sp. SubArs3]|uniref:arylsulfatase n=1 Tax=Flammeovirga sp. SubArs3 TaxID=2995316 RepID=UPI00248BED00|nr:arylsulfatase [Flammeovirga sp. SubArs3]
MRYFIIFLFSTLYVNAFSYAQQPNVILIVTDDQGYGDLGAHGNKEIHTPNIDHLYGESVHLTNFHVSPTCAPTRAAIMTGKYANSVGVWHTVMGRSLLYENEVTMADIFSHNNYKTAMFGKWHLGDNYPFSPRFRGFQEVLTHGGGGVGQTPDYWNNDYQDDVYLRNGEEEKVKGYCTDVWFRNALSFIETNKDQPFFCYISTNAPHGPLNVPTQYSKPYLEQGVPKGRAEFYGMISNIDDNLGVLRDKLTEWGIADNTILIFMTDNGTAYGAKFKDGLLASGYNAGMRGTKGSAYEGGHRVPCFFYWKGGQLSKIKDINTLTAHIDLLPTLVKMCGLTLPNKVKFDGTDLTEVLSNNKDIERILVGDSQRIEFPEKWRNSYTMKGNWRLVNNEELYNVSSDPGQAKNVIKVFPEIAQELRKGYEKNWKKQYKCFDRFPYIKLGTEYENPSTLTAHDWHVAEERMIPWNQKLIRKGGNGNGEWRVNFTQTGKYKISIQRYPKEANLPINTSAAVYHSEFKNYVLPAGKVFQITKGHLRVGDQVWEENISSENSKSITFEVNIPEGETTLSATLVEKNKNEVGAYYVYVEKL